MKCDVAVVGAGAAGMMCAAMAGQRGRRVVLVEHYHKLGEKIRISGGGRCNFTNVGAGPDNYLSQNPDFCRSALARYTPAHFVRLLESHCIGYHEKKLGQLFCDETAEHVIRMLRAECDRGGVEWRMPCAVQRIIGRGSNFELATTEGPLECSSLVIATGGLTVPKIGATPFGYQIAEQFGLRIVPPRPALVPLAFGPDLLARFGDLSGVSVDAEVSYAGASFRENLLFTHRGLSGPAILQISSYWDGRGPLTIDLLPDGEILTRLRSSARSAARLDTVLTERLPRRFAQQWCAAHELALPMHSFDDERLGGIAAQLQGWQVMPSGTLGYNRAEVTLGGVDTRDLSSRTMAALAVPALYFIGEVVDVTGWLGGYNFQWAWASANAAAQTL